MQSTGQTSTQALSLTLMQGSAITYGIEIPPCRWRRCGQTREFLPEFPGTCQANGDLAGPLTTRLLRAQAWIERVTQRVAEEVEGEHGQADGETREDRHPGRLLGELHGGATKHEAPRRRRLGHAKAQERQRRLEQDGLPEEG